MKGIGMTEYTAIEIKAPKIAQILKTLNPSLAELDYEKDLHLAFFVFDFPEPGTWTIVKPETFFEHFDSIENGMQIVLKQFIKK